MPSSVSYGRIILQAMADVELTIPLLPPSVNHYKKTTRTGRYYVTGEAESFKKAVAMFVRNRKFHHKWYAIEIIVTLGPQRKLDLDNSAKVILDALVKCNAIHSDAAVTGLIMQKRRGPQSRTDISIWEGKKP